MVAPPSRICSYCGGKPTGRYKQWRRGPDGPSTLCNSCGVRWRRTGSLVLKRRRKKSTAEVIPASARLDTNPGTNSTRTTATSDEVPCATARSQTLIDVDGRGMPTPPPRRSERYRQVDGTETPGRDINAESNNGEGDAPYLMSLQEIIAMDAGTSEKR